MTFRRLAAGWVANVKSTPLEPLDDSPDRLTHLGARGEAPISRAAMLAWSMASSTAAGNLYSGGAAVVDRYDDELAFVGEFAASDVVGIEIADHPAAAMEERQAGREAVRFPQASRPVDPRGDDAARRLDRQRLDRFEGRWFGVGDEAGLSVIFACFLRRERLIGRAAGLLWLLRLTGPTPEAA